MRGIAIRDRVLQMDVTLAREYAATLASNSNSIKELLERLATTVEELLRENKQLRGEA